MSDPEAASSLSAILDCYLAGRANLAISIFALVWLGERATKRHQVNSRLVPLLAVTAQTPVHSQWTASTWFQPRDFG